MTSNEPPEPRTCGLGCELPEGHHGDHDDLLGNTWPQEQHPKGDHPYPEDTCCGYWPSLFGPARQAAS